MAGEGRKGALPNWRPPKPPGRPRNPVTEARYREAAERGLTGKQAAEALGVTPAAVCIAARMYGLTFKDGRKG